MSENTDEISPNTLDNLSLSTSHIEPLSPRSIIDQIARNLAESTHTINYPLQSNLFSQPSFNTNTNSEAFSQQTNRERPRNSQCIDLTKEQDDVMIIADSPVTRRHNRRTNPSRSERTIAENTNDDIEILSSQRRQPRRRNQNPNETIVIDDDRNEASNQQSAINPSTRSEADLFSPSKRQKTGNTSTLNSDSDDEISGIPKCPLCLENLNELKQRNKKLVATPCGHVLCNKCLDEYFKSGGPQNKAVLCPTCRTKITKSKIITLFL